MSENPVSFKPAWWLPEGHSQTLWRKFLPEPAPRHCRDRIELDDGDFLDIDWCTETGMREQSSDKIVILIHGLCGCSQSTYIVSLQEQLARVGLSSVAVNLRGCSGEANRLARSYHSGVSDDLDAVYRHLQRRFPARSLCFVGFSLGGNVLLKWLGENRLQDSPVVRAVAVSTPFQLGLCSQAMTRGLSRIYGSYFVNRLSETFIAKRTALIEANNGDELAQLESIGEFSSLKNIWEFDERVTAPLNGFKNAEHYYDSCSSGPLLSRIDVDTLLIQSRDDPLIPKAAVPTQSDLSSRVELRLLQKGGHVGFVSAREPNWLERQITEYLLLD